MKNPVIEFAETARISFLSKTLLIATVFKPWIAKYMCIGFSHTNPNKLQGPRNMPNRITTVEECDATDDDSSNAAGQQKNTP